MDIIITHPSMFNPMHTAFPCSLCKVPKKGHKCPLRKPSRKPYLCAASVSPQPGKTYDFLAQSGFGDFADRYQRYIASRSAQNATKAYSIVR